MTNIKDISKQLMGEGLKAFHRKVGLESIEKNNEMQSKVLQGIYSQVDDNYLEKTEESNVIHLDGSGDGVVEVASIEGNSLVNLLKSSQSDKDGYVIYPKGEYTKYPFQEHFKNNNMIKPNTDYTFVIDFKSINNNKTFELNFVNENNCFGWHGGSHFKEGINIVKLTSKNEDLSSKEYIISDRLVIDTYEKDTIYRIIMLEGDWTDKEIPATYFEGLQSSFEEKVNDDDKYEIEISLNNGNLVNKMNFIKGKYVDREGVLQNCLTGYENYGYIPYVKTKENTQYTLSPLNTGHYDGSATFRIACYDSSKNCIGVFTVNKNTLFTFTTFKNTSYIQFTCTIEDLDNIALSYGNKIINSPQQLNKIKLLVNEPLRGLPNGVKDRLCVKDSKLVVERKCREGIIDGVNIKFNAIDIRKNGFVRAYQPNVFGDCRIKPSDSSENHAMSNKFKILSDVYSRNPFSEGVVVNGGNYNWRLMFVISDVYDTPQKINEYLINNPINIIYPLIEPYYEEVVNEYGEPILMEGYENGTFYIDSTIVPTTSVRYTQKFESRNELKNLNKNNISITSDINSNIIPYMMDVDMMIMEKEMAVMSQLNIKNIMKMEVLDMTSMQKRTFDMLKRLIEGKTLTEQECKDRVLVYLDADKITAEQASELMLIIAEKYA